MDPILIDECLSPELAAVARARGLVALHVTWLGQKGASDRTLAAWAAERGCIVVTNNRRDFLRLYQRSEVHNGLIVIVPRVRRAVQCRLFGLALDAAERQPSLVNLLIEVQADGTVEVRDWSGDYPAGTADRM
jgi:hypothetical protein